MSGLMVGAHEPRLHRSWSFVGRAQSGRVSCAYSAKRHTGGGSGSFLLRENDDNYLSGMYIEEKIERKTIKYLGGPLEWIRLGDNRSHRATRWLDYAEAEQLPIARDLVQAELRRDANALAAKRRATLEARGSASAQCELTGPQALSEEKSRRSLSTDGISGAPRDADPGPPPTEGP
jgi:hypothetical protein